LLLFILGAVLLSALVVLTHPRTKVNYAKQGSPALQLPDNVSDQGCGSQQQFFSTSPIQESDLVSIIPLGNPNPPAHTFPTDHIYLFLRRSGPAPKPGLLGPAAEVSVFAPGDIKVFNITAKEYLSSTSPHTDYAVDFAPCRELQGRFDHLASLSDKQLNEFQKATGECQVSSPSSGTTIKFCRKKVTVALKAGEIMGTAGGQYGSNNLDFRLSDDRVPALAYANSSRWKGDVVYVVCPVDYFSASMKNTLEKLFGDSFGRKRTIAPVCGTVMQDVKGTAQGVWFAPEKPTYPEDQHIALVPDNIDPTQLVFSIGESLKNTGINPERYVFLPNATGNINKEFRTVMADGHIYCYETSLHELSPSNDRKATLLLQLVSDTTLRIGPGSAGTCGHEPWSLISYKEFQR